MRWNAISGGSPRTIPFAPEVRQIDLHFHYGNTWKVGIGFIRSRTGWRTANARKQVVRRGRVS